MFTVNDGEGEMSTLGNNLMNLRVHPLAFKEPKRPKTVIAVLYKGFKDVVMAPLSLSV